MKGFEDYETAVLINSCDQGYGIFTLDDSSCFFFEKHLGTLCQQCTEFTMTHLLVVLDTMFKMMQEGLYSVSRLKVILLHLTQIKESDEMILDLINKFW